MTEIGRLFEWLLLACLAAVPLAAIASIIFRDWQRIAAIAVVVSLPTWLTGGCIIYSLFQLKAGISVGSRNAALMTMAFVLAYSLFFWGPPTLVGVLIGSIVKRKRLPPEPPPKD